MRSTRSKRWPTRAVVVAVSLTIALTVGTGAFAYCSYATAESAIMVREDTKADLARAQTDRESAEASQREREAAQKQADWEADMQRIADQRVARNQQFRATLDQSWSDLGWDSVGDDVYFRWADNDEFSCGRYDCLAFHVIAVNGCPGGMYLEAAILSGNTQVGWTNETFTGIPAGGDATGFFEDIYGQGDGFRLTEMNCR